MSSTDTRGPARPWGALIGALFLIALIAVWATQGTLSGTGLPVGRAATIAVGMTLQAIPFLLLGVFVAELIEAFIPRAHRACIPEESDCLRCRCASSGFPAPRM